MDEGFSLKRWLTTTNHKDIGILYLVTSIYFLIVGGVLALLFRIQLSAPELSFLEASKFNQAVTMHGLIMVLWVVSPMAFAFANYFVPIQIGARDLAFPRLNAMSYWLYLFSGILAALSFFLPGGAPDVGWTVYAPLNTAKYTPQPGMTLGGLALLMLIASITIGTVNFIVTIVRMRAPGITWSRLPMFTWSILLTVIMMLFAFPPLAAGIILLGADRVLGTMFYTSVEGGDLLWEHLFWFFGHPEVYIVLTPALGILFEIVPVFSRRPLYGRKFILGALSAATLISFMVWVHHMFNTTIDPLVKKVFSASTIAISLPFEIVAVYLIATMVGGAVRFRTPMLFALGSITLFIIGGFSGVYNASIALNYALRGTYWVVAHFHYVMAGTVVFALFAGLYYWFPKMTGRMYSERLGRLHFIISFIGFNLLYFPMHFLIGMPRRVFTYPADTGWAAFNSIATIGGFIFGLSTLLLFINLGKNLINGPIIGANPWKGWTLEWTIPSPPPVHNFDSLPDMTKGVLMFNGAPMPPAPKQHHTILPMSLSLGAALIFLGLVVALPIAVIGAVILAVSLAKWFKDDILDRFAAPEAEKAERWPFEHVGKEKLGVWVFLTSEIMLFGALISAYVYVRTRSAFWPPSPQLHDVGIGALNTLILLTSSLTMVLALEAIRNGSLRDLKMWLTTTLILGLGFLGIKAFEWSKLAAEGFLPSANLPAAPYYVLTGAHGVHVAAGLVAILYLILKARAGGFSRGDHSAVENTGLYWHLVDIVWVFLFPLFYLI